MAHPDDGRADPPVLDAIPQTTVYPSIPVHGTAEAGGTVLIKAMDGTTVSAEVQSSGRFCTDVMLQKEAVNTFAISVIDTFGNESAPVSLTVQQSGSPQQQMMIMNTNQSQNMATGGATSSSLSWDHGSGNDMIDGNADSFAGAWQRNQGLHWTDYITVQLSNRSMIDHIRIRAPGSCPLTAPFKLYISDADAPSDPDTTPMSWTWVKDFPANSANTDYTVKLDTPASMTHVSVYLDRGWSLGSDEVNCGNWWTWGAYYSISEIEVWSTMGPGLPPSASAPSCTSGSI